MEDKKKCFAKWKEDQKYNVCFRDQTILQFGDSWELLASFVLLNPGSALPIDREPYDGFLESKNLPFYVNGNGCSYYRFSIDRLMNDLLGLYSKKYFSGGVLKLYNLFNLKNQNSGSAIAQFKANRHHSDMFTASEEICFDDAPVVIASGYQAFKDEALTNELQKFIALADANQLYSLSKVADKLFEIRKAQLDKNGRIASYHPSYTFKYGNSTLPLL
jgi:hypothetical protein